MKRTFFAVILLFCLTATIMASAIIADPDPDMAEKWAYEAQIIQPPVPAGKGTP